MPKIVKPAVVLQMQGQVGPYERGCFLVNGLRVGDVTLLGKGQDAKYLLDKLRESGIPITHDSFKPIRGS